MISKIKKVLNKLFHSLRFGMLVAIIIALGCGTSAIVLSRSLFIDWVDNKYNSPSAKEERYQNYVADLQMFVDKNELSSKDTAEITRWVRSNRNIYLFIYKDDKLFFDSSMIPKPDEEEDTLNSEDKEDSQEDSKVDFDAETDGSPDNENGEASNENGSDATDSDKSEDSENESTEDNGGPIYNGGLTVQYPSREEIIESAKNNGLLPLTLSDGTLFVSLADFTEYIYYDVANIVSILVGVLILVLILMLYFRRILSKISNLAKDVSAVYEKDMNSVVRTYNGENELAVLTRNVEQMRSSMVESLENEKAAINANADLITSMSHDIRTPLTVLLGYIDIMKHSTEDEMISEYLKASENTALRLKELSDDLFRYFLAFGGKIQVDITDYDAKTLFDQLFAEHVLLLEEKGYRVNMTDKSIGSEMRVMADAPKTMRVIDNLFSNILKYADIERNVYIKAFTDGRKLIINVRNYVSKNVGEAESNGIGLKTCKKICEAMGADFNFGYSTDGEDKTFYATLGLKLI